MPQSKTTHYRLTPKAQQDLEDHWLYGAHKWSIEQADRYSDTLEETFKLLLASPELARERSEFDPSVRIHPAGKHLIIYRICDDHLSILRVLGGRQDWGSILRAVDQ